jgi:iron complex transport system substrate-binding protein
MSRRVSPALGVGSLNAVGALLAVTLASFAAVHYAANASPALAPVSAGVAPGVAPLLLEDGSRALMDHSGHAVRLADYRRIASTSSVADPLLRELCEERRILAFSSHSVEVGPDAYRYAHKPGVEVTHTEALLELAPDLVLVSSLADHAHTERLREAGLTVFDLGMLTGKGSLLDTIVRLGWLIGAPERAQSYASRFAERLEAVAADVPQAKRKRALYIGVYGNQLFGGSVGSSYHDVLTHAGLIDAAAERFTGWPSYTPEQVLTLNPELIVTQTGGRALLCRHTELQALAACDTRRIVEVDEAIINDAGVYMLDAAELVHRAVYGAGGAATP